MNISEVLNIVRYQFIALNKRRGAYQQIQSWSRLSDIQQAGLNLAKFSSYVDGNFQQLYIIKKVEKGR